MGILVAFQEETTHYQGLPMQSPFAPDSDFRSSLLPPQEPTPAQMAASGVGVSEMANKVIFIAEREMDQQVAHSRMAEFLLEKLGPEGNPYLLAELLDQLLSREETAPIGGRLLGSLLWCHNENRRYEKLWKGFLDEMINATEMDKRPSYRVQESGKIFAGAAYSLGEAFIQLYRLTADHYETISEFYSYIVTQELQTEMERRDQKAGVPFAPKRPKPTRRFKMLLDDLCDYITERSIYRTETLNRNNPNEFIAVLSDRLRSTRRYISQNAMNQHAIKKKRLLEKALKEREASAEEIIAMNQPFRKALALFHAAKLYNFKYVEVEKTRVTLQILPLFLGVVYLGAGSFELFELSPTGLVVALGGMVLGRLLINKKTLSRFYPLDVTSELEQNLGQITPVLKKSSETQFNSFLNKQVKEITDPVELGLLPEFIKYLISVTPDRRRMLMTGEQLNDCLDRVSMAVARRVR